MNDWKSRLRSADPGRDAVLPPAEVQRIRGVIVSAATETAARRAVPLPRAFVLAATVLVMLCASVLAALQRTLQMNEPMLVETTGPLVETAGPEDATAAEPASERDDERQQLHFETPGGTRIIWVFDSQFEARGTLP